jgi:hypothetical protein
MEKLVVLLFIFVTANPHAVFARKNSTEHAKQRRAAQVGGAICSSEEYRCNFDLVTMRIRTVGDPQ